MEINKIIHGNCIEVMKTFPDNSIDSIVCDPPYALTTTKRWKDSTEFAQNQSDVGKRFSKGFMGKEWDGKLPDITTWEECLRVAKPGAHMLAFGGTRTHHRLMVAIEDAGWEMRDCCMWLYGSGFPKSMDVSKALDKQNGVNREDKFEGLGRNIGPSGNKKCEICGKWLVSGSPCTCPRPQDEPQSEEAKKWCGWGTALKPAWEPIIMARKPFEGTVADNLLKWGVGAINIDACRIAHNEPTKNTTRNGRKTAGVWTDNACGFDNTKNTVASADPKGRFPANLILDEQTTLFLDEQTGILKSGDNCTRTKTGSFLEHGGLGKAGDVQVTYGDEGGASRFFYCAKASRSERNAGLEDMPEKEVPYSEYRENFKETKSYVTHYPDGTPRPVNKTNNTHPTVKPISLMRYLCRLITPKNALVLDPFTGSGSTCIAAVLEGFNYVGIELETEYVEIANKRINYWKANPPTKL